jgi:signal transduction histidine kinase
MRILVITSESRWADAVRAAFPSDDVMPGNPRQIASLRPMLTVCDACFVAETDLGAATVDLVKQLAAVMSAPLFAIADSVRPEWEESALVAGVRQVFRAPLRPGIVQLAVSRAQHAGGAIPRISIAKPSSSNGPTAPAREVRELSLFREFSRLLSYSSREPRFLTAYLDSMREVLGCARLVLYAGESGLASGTFQIASATGIDTREYEHFRMHRDHGIGRLIGTRGGVVLRDRLRHDEPDELAAARELAVFSAEIAVPLMTASGCTGILLVGSRIAGGGYSEHEVTLVYRLMESLGAALVQPVVNTPAAAERSVFPPVLHALPIGCALLDTSLRVIDTNDAFRSQLGRASANPLGIERLPAAWAEMIGAMVQKRATTTEVELDHELSGAVRRMRVGLQPLQNEGSPEELWLMVTEDITEETRLRQEIHEISSHNVLQRAGEQLSNEFRNSLTPIEILVQLSGESPNGRRDIDRLRLPVSMAIHRLRRRIDNLGYLTKTSIVPELTTVSAIFRSARERLDHWVEAKQLKTLVWSGEFSKVEFTADSNAVGLALAELVVNAIEAAGGRQVTVTAEDLPEAVNFKVRNPGEWSPPEEGTGFGHRPFVTAKSTGVGLGVEVASRVAEFHGGRLVLGPMAPDVVEAVLRLPRNLPIVPANFETTVAKAW